MTISSTPSWPATAATRRGRRAAHSTCQSGFSGGSQTWDTPRYLVKGTNISPDPETGIGKWSADDFKRALTEGVRPSGVALAPQMPFVFYKVLMPRDLDAVTAYVTAYVRSVTPVRNEVQPPVYRAPSHAELIPGAEKPMSEEELRDPGFKRGFYLATIAHCHGMPRAAPRWPRCTAPR